jgi:hypothetical protein
LSRPSSTSVRPKVTTKPSAAIRMPQSTPLDQLGGGGEPTAVGPPADEERVKRILAEMNAENSITPPPPVGGFGGPSPAVITEPPLSVSTGQVRMDPGTARAHVIGNATPSLADFHTMFAQTNPTIAPYHGPAANPPGPVLPAGPKDRTDFKTALLQWLRAPLMVGLIVFLLNLPVVTSILSRYAAWMYLGNGEISVAGLFVKTLLAVGLFSVYQGAAAFFDGSK